MIKIIEKQLIGKRPDAGLCEDRLFTGKDFAAVIDGVTGKGRQSWDGTLTSGGYAGKVIVGELETMPREIDRDGFFERIDNALSRAYAENVETDDITEWLRACMIVYSDFHRELWSVGDCKCLINGRLYETGKSIDTLLSELRSFVIHSSLISGTDEKTLAVNDCGREAIKPFLKMQLAFENRDTPYGYSVLNGHGVNMSGCVSYPLSAGDTVVLSSDGYPFLCDTLAESENRLSTALASDPYCYKELCGTKGIAEGNCSFDDRAYLKFTVCED